MHDGFDSSMIEIRNEDYKMFIETVGDLNNDKWTTVIYVDALFKSCAIFIIYKCQNSQN